MIIKQERVQGKSLAALKNHVLDLRQNKQNKHVEIIHGDIDLLEDWEANAEAWSRKYSVRHFVVNPELEMSDDERNKIVKLVADEYGIKSSDCVIIRHVKKKSAHQHVATFTFSPKKSM